jgi:histidyl-tRNA synthetase
VLRLIDRRDKMSPVEWRAYAGSIGLSNEQFSGLQQRLTDKELWRKSPELVRFFPAIEALGVSEYVQFAPHIIRGLLYYTGTVFEAWDVAGEFRALFGGGRYDNLVSDVGGEPVSAVGFALGDMVISLILNKYGCLPRGTGRSPAPVLVTVFDESLLPASLRLAAELRQAGLKVSSYPEAARIGKQFKYGDRMGMRVAVVLGPEEQQNDLLALKDLKTGAQQTIPRQEAVRAIRSILESQHPQE